MCTEKNWPTFWNALNSFAPANLYRILEEQILDMALLRYIDEITKGVKYNNIFVSVAAIYTI